MAVATHTESNAAERLLPLLKVVRVIQTEAEYDEACAEIYKLYSKSSSGQPMLQEELNIIGVLEKLIDDFTKHHFPDSSTLLPSESIQVAMEEWDYTMDDLAELLGGMDTALAIMENRAELTESQKHRLRLSWLIPAKGLMASNIKKG